jgi:hypothetical protein
MTKLNAKLSDNVCGGLVALVYSVVMWVVLSKMNSGVILFGSLSAATAGLGVWQLQRYYWKVDLIKKNEELFNLPLEPIGDTDNLRFVEFSFLKIEDTLVYQRS